mgnify:CR=1 FL=1
MQKRNHQETIGLGIIGYSQKYLHPFMSQMKMGGIINGIKRSKTHQRLEVRAMESGYRYLSYTVTQPERKSAGNRMIEQFIDKSWNMVFFYHFTYPEGSEDLETQSLRITKDSSALRESLRQFKAGEVIDMDALPEDARIMNAWLMEAENGLERRMLELYNLNSDHDYLLLKSYYLTLTAGNSGGSMSVSINNTQITQNGYGEEYMLCYFGDHQMFSGITQSISSYGGKRGQSITLCQLWEIEKTYFHQGRNLT